MYHHEFYAEIFEDACRSGDTTILRLFRIFKEQKSHFLVRAIHYGSIPVVTLLLEYGACENNEPFIQAFNLQNLEVAIEMVRLLLKQISTIEYMRDVMRSILRRAKIFNSLSSFDSEEKFASLVKLILNHAIQFANRLEVDSIDGLAQALGNHARLCKAIFSRDETQVSEILEQGNYSSYAEFVVDHRPSDFALEFGGSAVAMAFICKNVDTAILYFEAVRLGNINVLNLCAATPGFDPYVENNEGWNALQMACLSCQLDVIDILINKYRLDPDLRPDGTSLLLFARNRQTAEHLFKSYSEILVSWKDDENDFIFDDFDPHHCDMIAVFLELGADPELMNGGLYCRCGSIIDCSIISLLQKLKLFDEEYVLSMMKTIYPWSSDEFIKSLEDPHVQEYKKEISRIKNQNLSRSTSYSPGKKMYDMIFMNANEVARYSKNEKVLQIYAENKEDFRNTYPHYGFALNYRLRRGTVRREMLGTALEFLSSALGVGVPEQLSEFIFENFSNASLMRYSLESTNS